jgi:hypothetical protein
LPQLKRPRNNSDRNDDGTDGRARTGGSAPLVYFASGSGPKAATRGPHGVPLGGHHHSNSSISLQQSRQPHHAGDDANIGADGTVTFGPNLQLLMPSLAVRFDDHTEHGYEGVTSGGGGPANNGAASGAAAADGSPSSLALLHSRKRTAKKAKEWAAMSVLYSRAMEDKAQAAAASASSRDADSAATGVGGTDLQQQQWFMARFSYPIVHQSQTAMPPPPVPVTSATLMQQQQPQQGAATGAGRRRNTKLQQHPNGAASASAAAGSSGAWMPAASAHAQPIGAGAPPHLAHLLHTASASSIGSGGGGGVNGWSSSFPLGAAPPSSSSLHHQQQHVPPHAFARAGGAVEEEPLQHDDEDGAVEDEEDGGGDDGKR